MRFNNTHSFIGDHFGRRARIEVEHTESPDTGLLYGVIKELSREALLGIVGMVTLDRCCAEANRETARVP